MKITIYFLNRLNKLIKEAKQAKNENDMHEYNENTNDAFGMIMALYMLEMIDEKKCSDLTDKIWLLQTFTESDFS